MTIRQYQDVDSVTERELSNNDDSVSFPADDYMIINNDDSVSFPADDYMIIQNNEGETTARFLHITLSRDDFDFLIEGDDEALICEYNEEDDIVQGSVTISLDKQMLCLIVNLEITSEDVNIIWMIWVTNTNGSTRLLQTVVFNNR